MIKEMQSALQRIEIDLANGDPVEAFVLLNEIVCEGVKAGYKAAVTDLAIWNDGEQFVGVMRTPLPTALKEVDGCIVIIDEAVTVMMTG